MRRDSPELATPRDPSPHPGIGINDHNAWISHDLDSWGTAMAEHDDRAANGALLGPLDGVSVAVKDNIDVAGFVTTHGSGAFADAPASEVDAALIARLRAAGVAIVGKTHMTELACGTTGLNTHFGPATNPHDATRHPGGSSSGSAIAVAAGHVPLAIGSDTGGSIRIPASACGVVGLKPTFGRVSNRGMSVCSRPLDHAGPIAVDVATAAAALDAMQRPGWPAVSLVADDGLPPRQFAETLTVGVLTGPFVERCDDSVQTAFDAAIEALATLGCRVVAADFGLDPDEVSDRANVLSRDLLDHFGPYLTDELRSRVDAEVVEWLDLYAGVTDDDYADGLAYQNRVRVAATELHREIDIVICPTLRAAPCTIEEAPAQPRHLRAGNVDVFDVSGQPSLSLPFGTADGLPFGLLISGRVGDDPTVLRLGAAIEALCG